MTAPGLLVTVPTNGFRLRGKLVMMTLCMTLAMAVIFAAMAYSQVRATVRHAATDRLGDIARHQSEQIADVLEQTAIDATVFAGLPPVREIVQSDQISDGGDVQPESLKAQRQNRLQEIFRSILTTRPHYTQLRFIGRAENWLELVRVNRHEDHLKAIEPGDLQVKGGELYLKDLARLAAGHGYFSTVTYNREHGIEVGPPTIRYVRPALNEKVALYGVIVVNADFQALITAARPTVSEGFRLGVVTGLGDHMTFSADDSRPKLFYHSDPDFIPPPHDVEIASKAGPGQIFFAGDVAMAANAVVTPQLNRPFGLYVVTEMPRDALFAAANKMLVRNAVVAFVLIFLAIGIAGIFGAHLTDPLLQLADAVRRHAGAKPFDLMVSTNDEIGELTLAFASLGNQLLGQTLRARAIRSMEVAWASPLSKSMSSLRAGVLR